MIIDIGTGNVRVAVTKPSQEIVCVERDNVEYKRDDLYPEALYFEPERLWQQILSLARRALHQADVKHISAVTTSSQREGIVLLDAEGKGLIGLPNHDHRGREWEDIISDKDRIYSITGRYPGSLFSVFKILGIKHRRPEIYRRTHRIVSISDWALLMLSGVEGYEHSQASETQLYDVSEKKWSQHLLDTFGLSASILPPLHHSGSIIGNVLPALAIDLKISQSTPVVVGGADTQLAVRSTDPAAGDIVIVSGTTTPVVKISGQFLVDTRQRSWTNRHIDQHNFILETNAGVTGLNYQRLKSIFYPNEDYLVMEKEVEAIRLPRCVASLGSLVADEKRAPTKGGFVFEAPLSHELTRGSFAWAALWDIACSIRENFFCLTDITPYTRDYVWACGGGFQSRFLGQAVADLINKKIRIRPGFEQASVTGGTAVCNEALGIHTLVNDVVEEITPRSNSSHISLFEEWTKVREQFRQKFWK